MVVRPYLTGLCRKGADEHFIYRREKNLSKSLVGAIVLIEEYEGGVESITKFGDLGASAVGWYDGYRAGDDGNNEGGGR